MGDDKYRVLTHVTSQGHLVLAEDYGTMPRAALDAGHSKVECPAVGSNFSPDKFIKAGENP